MNIHYWLSQQDDGHQVFTNTRTIIIILVCYFFICHHMIFNSSLVKYCGLVTQYVQLSSMGCHNKMTAGHQGFINTGTITIISIVIWSICHHMVFNSVFLGDVLTHCGLVAQYAELSSMEFNGIHTRPILQVLNISIRKMSFKNTLVKLFPRPQMASGSMRHCQQSRVFVSITSKQDVAANFITMTS